MSRSSPHRKPALILIVLLAATLALGALPLAAAHGIVSAGGAASAKVKDNGSGKNANGHKGKSGNEQGNNKGKGKGPKPKKDDKGKAKGKGKKGEDAEDVTAQAIVPQLVTFHVDVGCTFSAEQVTTICEFTGAADGGAAVLVRVIFPAEAICAPVESAVSESSSKLKLTLTGQVLTAGTETYFMQTDAGVFPAGGPGLACAPSSGAEGPAATPPADLTHGTIVVTVLKCPPGLSGDDWFAGCAIPGSDVDFALVSAEASAVSGTRSDLAGSDGIATFERLDPGRYKLKQQNGKWCHAESDRVDADGLLEVAAGQRTNVWIFECSDSVASPAATVAT